MLWPVTIVLWAFLLVFRAVSLVSLRTLNFQHR